MSTELGVSLVSSVNHVLCRHYGYSYSTTGLLVPSGLHQGADHTLHLFGLESFPCGTARAQGTQSCITCAGSARSHWHLYSVACAPLAILYNIIYIYAVRIRAAAHP